MKSKATLEGQHFHLGVIPQKVGANAAVKDVSVQHSAVLHHRLLANTNRQIDTPKGMNGLSIPYSYGHCLSFLERFQQAPGHHRECCAGVENCPKNLMPAFHKDPENELFLFRAAPLLSIRNFTSTPTAMSDLSIQANRLFLELAFSGEWLFPFGRFSGSAVAGQGEVAGVDERLWGYGSGLIPCHLFCFLCTERRPLWLSRPLPPLLPAP